MKDLLSILLSFACGFGFAFLFSAVVAILTLLHDVRFYDNQRRHI
jgi:hypothetical protein